MNLELIERDWPEGDGDICIISSIQRCNIHQRNGPERKHVGIHTSEWMSGAKATSWTTKGKKRTRCRRQRVWRCEQFGLILENKVLLYKDPFKERWMKLAIHAIHLKCWTYCYLSKDTFQKKERKGYSQSQPGEETGSLHLILKNQYIFKKI